MALPAKLLHLLYISGLGTAYLYQDFTTRKYIDSVRKMYGKPLGWIYVDMNSYFASVEQQLNPKLRGKPIGVVPTMAETTCCIAASYEAKKFGVKTGTLVYEARKICPEIQFVTGNHYNYIEYHNKIVDAVESCLPVTTVASIDEVACQLTGRDQKTENAIALAHEIKQKIYRVGSELSCSIGIAPNRFLAKVAADMQKPNGLTVIDQRELPKILYSLKLSDFPGIGYAMEKRLLKKNIGTVEELCNLNAKKMYAIWGSLWGERFYRWLRGEDLEISFNSNQSIGHSHVLPPKLRTEEGSYAVAQKLLQKAAMRLRKINGWAREMSISVRDIGGMRWSQSLRMMESQDTLTLLENFRLLWSKKPKMPKPIKVSVTFFNLLHDSERTLSFFENHGRIRLSHAVDVINQKYGKNKIYFAGIYQAMDSAPLRIAFTNIPDIED